MLAFFYLSALNLFFSFPLLASVFGLPYLVLMSRHLDWSAWIVSGNLFAWTCLLMAKRETRWMLYLGVLALAGSLLQVLPTVLPAYVFMSASWVGEVTSILMPFAAAASIVMSVKDSDQAFSLSRVEAMGLFLKSMLSLVIPLQIWSITTALPFAATIKDYTRFNTSLFYSKLLQLLFPLTLLSFVLLVTEWVWFPIIAKAVTNRVKRGPHSHDMVNGARGENQLDWKPLVGFAVLLAVLVSSYQWSRGYPLGQDARYYAYVLGRMDTMGLRIAFSTERPFLFVLLHSIKGILGLEVSVFLRLVPLALGGVLVCVTYWFTKVLGRDAEVAGVAALFAAVSPYITVGTEFFLITNWLAIAFMMLFLYAFSQSISHRSFRFAILSILLSGLTLGVHYFTFFFMMSVLIVYFLLSLIEKRSFETSHPMFTVALFSCCMATLVPAFLFAYSTKGGMATSLELAEHMVSLFLTQATPSNLINLLLSREQAYLYFGKEHYAIPLLCILALVGSVKLSSSGTDEGRLLRAWLVTSSIGAIVVQYDELWRFLYVIPFEILAAFGFIGLLRAVGFNRRLEDQNKGKSVLLGTGLQLIVLLVLGFLLAFSDLPSLILFLGFIPLVFVELLSSKEERDGTILLLLVFLALEQVCRALCALE